jgi:hypothetical protein
VWCRRIDPETCKGSCNGAVCGPGCQQVCRDLHSSVAGSCPSSSCTRRSVSVLHYCCTLTLLGGNIRLGILLSNAHNRPLVRAERRRNRDVAPTQNSSNACSRVAVLTSRTRWPEIYISILYINITISSLEIIHSPDLYLKHSDSETEFCLLLQV